MANHLTSKTVALPSGERERIEFAAIASESNDVYFDG